MRYLRFQERIGEPSSHLANKKVIAETGVNKKNMGLLKLHDAPLMPVRTICETFEHRILRRGIHYSGIEERPVLQKR